MIEGASPLHQALYAAIEADDAKAFDDLARQHLAEILEVFSSWLKVPEAIRSDEQAANRYVQSVFAVAQAFEAAGVPSLMQQLAGRDESNPIIRWQNCLARAQALSEAGEPAQSSVELKAVLAEMEGASGSAVISLLPKIYGRLGFNALHERQYDAALEYTQRAYQAAQKAGDAGAVMTYYENLVSQRLIRALALEPERAQPILAARRLIARAQDSADAGRYRACLDQLKEASAIVDAAGTDELALALRPKLNGLRGFAEFKLGLHAEAREHTVVALETSRLNADAEGVRIYTANLEAMSPNR